MCVLTANSGSDRAMRRETAKNKGLPRETLFSIKTTWHHGLALKSCAQNYKIRSSNQSSDF